MYDVYLINSSGSIRKFIPWLPRVGETITFNFRDMLVSKIVYDIDIADKNEFREGREDVAIFIHCVLL